MKHSKCNGCWGALPAGSGHPSRKSGARTLSRFYFRHYLLVSWVLLLLLTPSLFSTAMLAFGSDDQDGYTFHITIEDEEEGTVYELTGVSEFTVTPSSYSIHLNGEYGRCVVHLLNFKEPPGPGIYDVEQPEEVRTAVVCVIQEMEPLERMSSHAGTFTITEMDDTKLAGHLDMVLKGGITGKSFRLTGMVASEQLPLNLDF